MGHQIIKERDTGYAVFSSNTDTFVMREASPNEIAELFVEMSREQIETTVRRIVAKIDAGEDAYFGRGLTLIEAEALDATHRDRSEP